MMVMQHLMDTRDDGCNAQTKGQPVKGYRRSHYVVVFCLFFVVFFALDLKSVYLLEPT